MDIVLRDRERLDDLQYEGLMLIQRSDLYCFTSDAVLLANLAKVKKGATVADLGSGSGIISVLIAKKRNCRVIAVEIQQVMAELTRRNAELNKLDDKIEVINADIADCVDIIGKSSIECVVCNPPYFPKGSGAERGNKESALSRHESSCDLKGIISAASDLLAPKGKMYMIHKVSRMAEVITAATCNGLEPKEIMLIYPKADRSADTFVICCVKGGGAGMKLSSLTVYNDDGSMTEEAAKLYAKQ